MRKEVGNFRGLATDLLQMSAGNPNSRSTQKVAFSVANSSKSQASGLKRRVNNPARVFDMPLS